MKNRKRPTSVTVIGWVFITVGIFMILSGTMGFVSYTSVDQVRHSGLHLKNQDMPAPFSIMPVIFKYYGVLATLQVIVASLIILSSIYFLKLKKWARVALEIFSWLAMLYVFCFGLFAVFLWTTLAMGVREHIHQMRILDVVGIIMAIVMILVFSIPIGLIIKTLRSEQLRRLFAVGNEQ